MIPFYGCSLSFFSPSLQWYRDCVSSSTVTLKMAVESERRKRRRKEREKNCECPSSQKQCYLLWLDIFTQCVFWASCSLHTRPFRNMASLRVQTFMYFGSPAPAPFFTVGFLFIICCLYDYSSLVAVAAAVKDDWDKNPKKTEINGVVVEANQKKNWNDKKANTTWNLHFS